jgi:hypothetical protein
MRSRVFTSSAPGASPAASNLTQPQGLPATAGPPAG